MPENNPEIRLRNEASLPLFDRAYARKNDPQTSHDASRSVTNLGPTRDAIINVLYTFGPQTDEGIAAIFKKYYSHIKVSEPGLRSRRAELCKAKYGTMVEDSGQRGKTELGNDAVIWRLKK